MKCKPCKSNWTEIPGKKVLEIRLSFIQEIVENAVPFTTGNFGKWKPKFLVNGELPWIVFSSFKYFLKKSWILTPFYLSTILKGIINNL